MDEISQLADRHRLDLHTIIVFRKAERAIALREGSAIRACGLTVSQFGLLEPLYSKGDMCVGELIQKTLATSGNMTVIIKNAEKNGWIRRYPDPKDARSFRLTLTERGREQIEKALPKHIENIGRILSVLTDEDKQDLIRILRKFKNL